MRKLFFGFLFIMIRILVKGFDIFPDPIGYGLIYLGASELAERAPGFDVVRRVASFGAIFTLALLGYDVFAAASEPSPTLVLVMGILGSAVGLVLIYAMGTNLLESFGQLRLNQEGLEALKGLRKSWSSYFTAMAISTGVVLLLLLNPISAGLLIVLVAGLLGLIFAIQFLVRLYRFTSKEPTGIYLEKLTPEAYPQEHSRETTTWQEIPDDNRDDISKE